MLKALTKVITGDVIVAVIVLFFVFTFLGFIKVIFDVGKIQKTMDETHKHRKGRGEYTPGGYKKSPDVYTWEENLMYMEDFNKAQVVYSMLGQLVPVFPLLGLLGTVSGLITQLQAEAEVDNAIILTNLPDMVTSGTVISNAGLSDAMVTTFVGLIAAIVLKMIDAFWVSKKINDMDLYFDTFEQNYHMSRDKMMDEAENGNQGE